MSTPHNTFSAKRFWHPEQPFNELPLLPPAAELETRAILKQCIKARAALAELKQAAELFPNQSMLINTPPVGIELLRSLLANWERFLHDATELDPLIRMAVAHYQFEAIHPFTDGNGRTGRILNSLFFISEGLLTLPILYLSRFIIQNKADYYRLLLSVTQDEVWDDWILFLLKGVQQTAHWTVAKIAAIRDLQAHTVEYVRLAAPKIYSHELVNLIFEQPYCRIQNVTARDIAGRQTASAYLKTLVKANVLIERQVGREKLFIHPKLMTLLTRDANDWRPYSRTTPPV